MNIWKLTSETTDGTKVITSVIIALNPKEALEVFKDGVTGYGPTVKVKQLGQAATNYRTAEIVLTNVS